MPEFSDVAKIAASEVVEIINADIDKKIAKLKARAAEIPGRIKDLEESRDPLIEQKVNSRLARLEKAGITITVPPGKLGMESH